MSLSADDDLSARLGRNAKQLREARGLTQDRVAKLAGVPRATYAHLESGAANPTVAVLHRVATALAVTIEELLSVPRAGVQHYPKGSLEVVVRGQGGARVHKLLPDPVPGMEIDRIELAPGGRMAGVPHTPGTREYLTCERGEIVVVAAGDRAHLREGDVLAFRGDLRHSYANPGAKPAIGFSVVVLARLT